MKKSYLGIIIVISVTGFLMQFERDANSKKGFQSNKSQFESLPNLTKQIEASKPTQKQNHQTIVPIKKDIKKLNSLESNSPKEPIYVKEKLDKGLQSEPDARVSLAIEDSVWLNKQWKKDRYLLFTDVIGLSDEQIEKLENLEKVYNEELLLLLDPIVNNTPPKTELVDFSKMDDLKDRYIHKIKDTIGEAHYDAILKEAEIYSRNAKPFLRANVTFEPF